METSKEKVKSYYDDAVFKKLFGFINSNKRVECAWDSILTIINSSQPKQILEIGCGIGEISARLANASLGAKVVGFDISENSIVVAEKLFGNEHVQFLCSDSISSAGIPTELKFDLIVMMDVYEHIHPGERPGLHEFLLNHISKDGFLFLSCPTPKHLTFLRCNHSEEIQPVDEDITLQVLHLLSEEAQLNFENFKEVSVWHQGDYFHAVFSTNTLLSPASKIMTNQRVPHNYDVANLYIGKLKQLIRSSPTSDVIKRKRELIKSRLGEDILKIVDAS